MQEQRKYIRVTAPVAMSYQPKNKTLLSKKTIIKDFSEGGIRFPAYEKLKSGVALQLQMRFPVSPITVGAEGKVVWIKRKKVEITGGEFYDLGVKFTKIQPADRRKIAQINKDSLDIGRRY